ncbi:MAG: hypothetical protein AAGG44_14305, partial [Planctomycetota bacterium]
EGGQRVAMDGAERCRSYGAYDNRLFDNRMVHKPMHSIANVFTAQSYAARFRICDSGRLGRVRTRLESRGGSSDAGFQRRQQ